jgi:hypothetical protein
VPIHKEAWIDLKPKREVLSKDKKKIENQEKKGNRRPKAKESVCQRLSLVPTLGHPVRLENRKGRCGQRTQQKKKKIENQKKS